ncbi:RHS repeat-associated core domain-containing protein [Ekhidna sp.]|uniref:RHS repeat-associated core domain-containing protein n=1 Tax=Ekhidna sp. TaxID=2608089 RepID=UPI0032F0242D
MFCDSYTPFGLEFNSYSRTASTPQKYKYNGMEEQEETGWLQPMEYRMYDPAIARFLMIDPIIKHHESPYAWNTNNPLSFADPLGSDSTQRANALAKAEEFVDQNPGSSWVEGAKGGPGENVDCSGMTSACVVAGGEADPISQSDEGGGVQRTNDALTSVDESDVVPGNLVILDNSKSGKDNPTGHTGIITEVAFDKDGNITTLKMIDSGGSEGPRRTTLMEKGNKEYWGKRITGFKKWDSKPDKRPPGQLKEVIIQTSGTFGLQKKGILDK